MSWLSAELGSVSKVQAGQAAPKKESFGHEGIPFIRAGSLEFLCAGGKEQKLELIPESNFFKLKMKLYKAGTVVFAKSGMSATLGRIYKLEGDCSVVSHLATVSPMGGLDSDYLKYWFLQKPPTRLINDPSYPSIRASDIKALKIPLPPLTTQKQIATVLEKADQLRKDCQQMEQELNNLAQSVFIDMFGDPVTNPKGWEKKKLSDLVSDFQGGKSLAAPDDEHKEFKHYILKISAVTSGEFKPDEAKPVPDDYLPPIRHYVRKGDLIFSRANTTELVGATTLVFDTPNNRLLPDKLWRFVWKNNKLISSIFMWQLFSNFSTRNELSKISSGSGGSMKNISKKKLYDLGVICPPLDIQKSYENIYWVIRSQATMNAKALCSYDLNFNSLIQKAFKGELNLKTA